MAPFACVQMEETKRVARIAHDHKQTDPVEWVRFNKDLLARHDLCATRTTGRLIAVLIFFWDPLEPLSRDRDVRALLRIAVVWNVPVACNRAMADFLISAHV